jgi:Septum formation
MRRGRLLVAGLATLATLAMAGCNVGKPAGVDGDLTNDWPALAEAKTPVPAVGACYDADFTDSWSGDFDSKTVDCSKSHMTETTYVGTFTGALASRSVPPLADSADLAEAFTACTEKTTDYLGGPWQSGYTWLGITLPGSAAWKGGARWYRCEIVGVSRDINQDFIELTGSAKGKLAAGGDLARTCSVLLVDSSNSITADDGVDCSKPHNSEFSGTYTLSGSAYPGKDKVSQQADAACKKVLATFLGSDSSQYFGWSWWNITERQWTLGVRQGACEITASTGKGSTNKLRYTGSAKGIGNRKPTNWTTG